LWPVRGKLALATALQAQEEASRLLSVRLWTEDPFSEIHFIRYRSIGYTLHSSTSEQGTGAKDDLIFDCSIFGVRILTPMRTDGSTVLEIGINVKVTGAL
jgi:hypothetical protein